MVTERFDSRTLANMEVALELAGAEVLAFPRLAFVLYNKYEESKNC